MFFPAMKNYYVEIPVEGYTILNLYKLWGV